MEELTGLNEKPNHKGPEMAWMSAFSTWQDRVRVRDFIFKICIHVITLSPSPYTPLMPTHDSVHHPFVQTITAAIAMPHASSSENAAIKMHCAIVLAHAPFALI